jgi:hypothetical protein
MGMSDRDEQFQGLLDRVKAGEEAACGELYDNFRETLLVVLRRKLSNHVRALYDEEDAFQSSFWIFIEKMMGQVFENREQAIAYVYRVACRRLQAAHRRYLDGKHLTRRARQDLDKVPDNALAARGPGPADRAAWDDWCRVLCQTYPSL